MFETKEKIVSYCSSEAPSAWRSENYSSRPAVSNNNSLGVLLKRIIFTLILFCFVSFPITAEAASSKQKQLDELKRQIAEQQRIVEQKQREAQSLANEIAIMDGQIRETEITLEATRVNIEKTNEEIAQKEEELRQQRKILNESLRLMYEEKETSLLETLLSSKSFSAVLDRIEYLNIVKTKIDSTIQDIQRIKRELESKKKSLEVLKKQQEDQAAYLNSQRSAKNQLLADTRGEEALYQQKVEADKSKYAAIKSAMEIDEGRGNYGCAYPGSFQGFFFWPIDPPDQHRNVGKMGCDGGYSGHTGIDFGKDLWTPIRASANGKVEIVSMNWPNDYNTWPGKCSPKYPNCGHPDYGNYVVVSHQYGVNTFYTLYAHMLRVPVVSVGQPVDRGNVIGYQGDVGYSSVSHLHFEIRTALPGHGGVWNPLPFLP